VIPITAVETTQAATAIAGKMLASGILIAMHRMTCVSQDGPMKMITEEIERARKVWMTNEVDLCTLHISEQISLIAIPRAQ
jgi:hypothetical protein